MAVRSVACGESGAELRQCGLTWRQAAKAERAAGHCGCGEGALYGAKKPEGGAGLPFSKTGQPAPDGPAVSAADSYAGGLRLGYAGQRQLGGGAVPAGRCLRVSAPAAAVCRRGTGGTVGGQPGGLPHLSPAGLATAGAFTGAADGGAVYAGIQRLQAVDRTSGAGNPAAQRNRQVFGGSGVQPHHCAEPKPHGPVPGRGAAVCGHFGCGGGADAAGAASFRHAADSGHWGGADVCGRHRASLVWAGGGRCAYGIVTGAGAAAGSGALCGRPAFQLAGPLCRPAGRRPPDHSKPVCHWVRRGHGPGPGQQQAEAFVRAGAAERFHLFHPVRRAGLCGGGAGAGAVLSAAVARAGHRGAGAG